MLRSVACTHIPICPLPPYLLSGKNHIYSFIVDSSSVYSLPMKENIDVCKEWKFPRSKYFKKKCIMLLCVHLKQICRDTVHPFKVYTWVIFHKFIRVLYPLPQSVLEQFHHPRKKTPYPLVIISLALQLTTSLRQPLFQLDCHIDVPVLVI